MSSDRPEPSTNARSPWSSRRDRRLLGSETERRPGFQHSGCWAQTSPEPGWDAVRALAIPAVPPSEVAPPPRSPLAESPQAADLTGAALLSDSELVSQARQGDRRSFGTLYLRHHDAAWRVACAAAGSPTDAEDAVAEGFAKVFAALPAHGRPGAGLPALPAGLRAQRRRRPPPPGRRSSTSATTSPSRSRMAGDPDEIVLADLERNLVGEALRVAPRAVADGPVADRGRGDDTDRGVSAVIGIKPNAVAALSYRAREGLREAYLQAHVRAEAKADCRYTVDRLGPYVRSELADAGAATRSRPISTAAPPAGSAATSWPTSTPACSAPWCPVPLLLGLPDAAGVAVRRPPGQGRPARPRPRPRRPRRRPSARRPRSRRPWPSSSPCCWRIAGGVAVSGSVPAPRWARRSTRSPSPSGRPRPFRRPPPRLRSKRPPRRPRRRRRPRVHPARPQAGDRRAGPRHPAA